MSLDSSRLRRWLPLVFLALLPLIPLWRAVFLGEAIGPFDQIRQMAPWDGPKPAQPWDVLQADGVLQFFPWRDMVFEAWGKGKLPLWNPYELGGAPLLANSQSGGFYPPHIVLGLLHFPTALAITLLAWMHLAWAAFGVYFLTRRLGGSRLGSTVAGASFSLSPFMVGWTALASVIETVSWIPWILACIVALFRDTRASNWAGRRLAVSAALASSVAMLLLAGHLQFAAYGLLAAFVLTVGMMFVAPMDVYMIAVTRDPRSNSEVSRRFGLRWLALVGIGAVVLTGALLSAPQILPVLSYSKFSHRQNTPTQEGYAAYVAGSIKPFELGTLAYPTALGSPRKPIDAGNGVTLSEYWPILVKPGANFTESALSLGPLILAGLFLVPWKRKELWPLAILGALSLLLALGTALNMPLYFLVPGWSASGSPGRVIVLFLICGCVIGGYGLGEASRLFSRRDRIKAGSALAIGVLIAFAGPMLAPASKQALAREIQSDATSSLLPTLIIGLVLTVMALALMSMPALSRYRPAVALFPALLCWLAYGSDLIMTGKPLDPIQGVPADQRVAFVNGPWSLGTAAHAAAPPNTASLSRIHELGGYDSLLHRDSVALLRDIDGEDPAPPTNGNMMLVKPNADPKKLAEAGVTAIWPRDRAQPEPLDGPGRCTVRNGVCKIVEETYDRITLTALGSGRLTLRDRMMPGWEAKVDGRRAVIEGGVWRIVDLGPPGNHRVEFTYHPPGMRNGILLAGLGLIGLAVLLLSSVLYSRRGGPERV